MPSDMATEFISDADKNFAGCYWTKISVADKLSKVLSQYQPDYVVSDIQAMKDDIIAEVKKFYYNEIVFYKRRIKELEGIRDTEQRGN